jgi:hypothetical protein
MLFLISSRYNYHSFTWERWFSVRFWINVNLVSFRKIIPKIPLIIPWKRGLFELALILNINNLVTIIDSGWDNFTIEVIKLLLKIIRMVWEINNLLQKMRHFLIDLWSWVSIRTVYHPVLINEVFDNVDVHQLIIWITPESQQSFLQKNQ